MELIAGWIGDVVTAANTDDESAIQRIRAEITDLCLKFPSPPGIPSPR
jgi:hypothetical protein